MVESGETGKVVKVLESTTSGNCLFFKDVLSQELRGPDMGPISRFMQSGYLMAPQESPRVIKNESIVLFFCVCTQVTCDSCVQRGRSKSKPLGDGETLKGGLQNRSGGLGRTTLVLRMGVLILHEVCLA